MTFSSPFSGLVCLDGGNMREWESSSHWDKIQRAMMEASFRINIPSTIVLFLSNSDQIPHIYHSGFAVIFSYSLVAVSE